jgi:omega-6 fatty acid desaturase (delta-12 desaturase)
MSDTSTSVAKGSSQLNWRQAVAGFQRADHRRSAWQLINTLAPYLALWVLMVLSLRVSYWLTLALAIPAAGFMVRTFIIFHDCCHNSFFRSRRANEIVGIITGVLTFTPYYFWRHSHALHHATAGDLDRRGVGDVWTMTLEEYRTSPLWRRAAYRFMRFPLVTFGIGPLFMFVFAQRFPTGPGGRRERVGVWMTDLALLGILGLAAFTIGIRAYILVQLPIIWLGGAAGIWLFYVQHNFPDTYWERHERWDYAAVGLQGSSYYQLPALLRWFSGSIGFHHIHHLSPRTPNYLLKRCHEASPVFDQVKPVTMLSSLAALKLRVWDEKQRKLVGFGQLRTQPASDGV